MATRLHAFAAWERAPEEGRDGNSLRRELDTRRHRRTLRRRFRRHPDAYLAELETALLKRSLPPYFFLRSLGDTRTCWATRL